MLAKLKSLLKIKGEDHCPICGEVILGEGIKRHGKRFCQTWHADFYHPPPPWWRRIRWPDDAGDGGGSGCCA